MNKFSIFFSYPILLSFFLIPSLFSLWNLQARFKENEHLTQHVKRLYQKENSLAQAFHKHSLQLSQIKKSSPYYIPKEIESLSFLNSETEKLQMILDHYKESPQHQLRLDFLKSGNNRLSFKEEKKITGSDFQETLLTLASPIEADEDDLKKTVFLIEENNLSEIGKPQLIFKEFDLIKIKTNTQDEVFVLDFNIIKREAL